MRTTLILLMALLAVPAVGLSATLLVPTQYTTIQGAIDAAVDDDTVLVDSGTYVENIDFLGKAITVVSNKGPINTIIDGGSPVNPYYGACVTFENDEGPDSILDGFTLTNGTGTYDPVTATRCGGGISATYSNPTIINNIVKGNLVTGYCGGIACGNTGSQMVVAGNIICDNTAVCDAGGIGCRGTSLTIMNNIIYNNKATRGGGLQITQASSPMVMNNIIFENSASSGGGIHSWNSTPTIINNTFYGNSGLYSAGCIMSDNFSSVMISNSIFWDSITGGAGPELWVGDNSTLSISYSDVDGGQGAAWVSSGSTLDWGAGMIDQDPLFSDPANAEFHLTGLSPCINRGTDAGAPAEDIDGDTRPCMGTVDMGADEFTGTHPLEADNFSIPASTGGQVDFTLDSGAANANRWYILLGSITGTAPGTPLPGGKMVLPLNWDLLTGLLLSVNPPGFMGQLDNSGSANVTFTAGPLPPGAVGLTLTFADALNNPWDFVSNPINVVIVQ